MSAAPAKRPETVTFLAACPCGFPNAVWAGVVDAANGGGTRYELECSHCGIEGDLPWAVASQAARRIARGEGINQTRETFISPTPLRRPSVLGRIHRTAKAAARAAERISHL